MQTLFNGPIMQYFAQQTYKGNNILEVLIKLLQIYGWVHKVWPAELGIARVHVLSCIHSKPASLTVWLPTVEGWSGYH